MSLAIFDLDGTLVDSSKVLVNSINYVRQRLHLPAMESEDIMYGITNPESDIAQYFYGLDSIEKQHEEWFKEYYSQNCTTQIELFEGVEEMLYSIRDANIEIALATNGYRDSTLQAVEYLGIEHFFSDIACFDDVARGKPAPDMLELLLKRRQSDVKSAIFIGDSDRDKLAAKAANIEFLQVDFGQNSENILHTPLEVADRIDLLLYKDTS